MKKIIASVIFLSLVSCAAPTKNAVDTTNLGQIQAISYQEVQRGLLSHDIGQLRIKALQDTAMSLGAQAGLANASEQINQSMEKDRKYLETTFNFNGMMLSHGVIPPVLVEGDNSLNLADPDTIRIADKTYKIIAQARFATTPPNWRDYLWLTYNKPDVPNRSLLPKNKDEQVIWSKAIKVGWDNGIQQAYSIFQQNVARLKRDYQGMILYRKLLQEKMISPPYVSRTSLGVTGTGEDMRVNDEVLRITQHPKLQTDTKDWRAVVVTKND